MPRKEPPAAVDLRIVIVGNRGAHSMMRIGVRAPTLRITGIAFGALLHFTDGSFQAGKLVR
jgi:hypothetical protein